MRLIQQLMSDEGYRRFAYRDPVGQTWTIGYGRNLEDVGVDKEEALYLLKNDIERARQHLARSFEFFEELDGIRQDVLINMCFNIGINRLLGFRRMIRALQMKNYDKAAAEMVDSLWYMQVPNRVTRLAQIMKTGVWP